MMTRNNLVVIFFFSFYLPLSSSALIINEIMFDPDGSDTDREWIELLNDTNDTLDLTSWKFFEANTNHGLTSFQGGMVIPVGGYAVIASNPAKFLQDNPTFQGSLIKSSFSLSNSGEYLAMKNSGGAIQDSLTYIPSLGGQDDGSTLSLLGGSWIRGDKTPGASNVVSTLSSLPANTPQSGNQTNTSTQIKDEITYIAPAITVSSDLTVNTVNEKIVLAGADSEFTARASLNGKTVPENAEFIWSFGDGGTKKGKSVGYHYQYPGVYVAVVEVTADGGVATSKTRVKVIAPELSISDIGYEVGKNYIEITNSSSYEVDLSNWLLSINNIKYTLPKNTVIMGKQKVRFAGKTLGFDKLPFTATATIKILYPDHMEMLRFVASTTSEVQLVQNNTVVKKIFTPSTTTYRKPALENKVNTANATTTKNQSETKRTSWFQRFLSKL